MAITYGFFNAIKQSDGTYDRVYNSDQISNMFEGLISDGVFESVDDAMIVKAKSGMTIEVGAGRATVGSKWIKNDAKLDITLQASHLTLNRYSAIVIRADYQNRTIEIVEKVGTAATSPTKPAIEKSQTIEEKCLAYIYVGKGVAAITQANITDTRTDSNICGFVTGVVKQVDTSELFLQWQTAYEQFYNQMLAWQNEQKSLFDTWFAALTEQLQVNTYIRKFHKTVEIAGSATETFALDMDGYAYSASDILLVNINGIAMVEVYDYLIDTSKTPVEMHTNVPLDVGNILEITVLKSVIGQT